MKNPLRFRNVICVASLAATGFSHAASLTWDSSGANPANPVDGPGSWDTVAALWSNGVSDVAWVNANADTAVFGNANGAAGSINLTSPITVGGMVFNPAGSGTYVLSGAALTMSGASVTVATNANAEIGSVLAGSSTLVKTGAGKLTITGANTYTGGTIISEGTLSFLVGSNQAGPNMPTSGTLTLNGGTLQFAGVNNTYNTMNRPIVLTEAGGTIDFAGAGSTYVAITGPITYSGSGPRTLTLSGSNSSSQTPSLNSSLTDGSGGATSVVKNGTSIWNMSGSHTYTGDTTINGGILRGTGGADRLSTTSTFYIAAAGTLSLNYDQTIANLQDGVGGGGAITQAFSNGTTVKATIQSGSFSGQIRDTNVAQGRLIAVNKTTAETLRLSGTNNSYSGGTTISAGTLLVNNPSGNGLGLGTVSVTSSTLGGNGFIALGGASSINVGAEGVVAAGDSDVAGGIGTLTLNGGNTTGAILDMQADSSFTFDLAAGNLNDTIRFYNYAGASDFLRDGGGVALNFTGAQEGTYDLFLFYSDAGTTLAAAGFGELTSNFVLGSGLTGYTATWDYSTTGVISLSLIAVPEPSVAGLVLLGLAAGLRRRRQ